jgi:sugar phosphate isomerase/epimerase
MSQTRRDFLLRTAQLGAMTAILPQALAQEPAKPAAGAAKPVLFELSLAEWSLHQALQAKTITNLDFPVLAAKDYGIRVVEYVNSFFKESAHDEKYLAELNLRCKDNGVTNHLIMCDGEGSLAASKKEERAQAVTNHKRWADAAKTLGCRTIRVNVYGDGSRDEQQSQAADGLVQLAEYAGPLGLNVIVENHGGITSDGSWMAGVMKKANNPRIGTLPDFGNFNMGEGKQYDRYQGVTEMMPYAKAVSAKSYDFDDKGNETTIDYEKMLKIVLAAGYHSWLGIEYEGSRLSEKEGILATKALLLRLREKLA